MEEKLEETRDHLLLTIGFMPTKEARSSRDTFNNKQDDNQVGTRCKSKLYFQVRDLIKGVVELPKHGDIIILSFLHRD